MNSVSPPGSVNTGGIFGWNGNGDPIDQSGNVIPGGQRINPQPLGVVPTYAQPPAQPTSYTSNPLQRPNEKPAQPVIPAATPVAPVTGEPAATVPPPNPAASGALGGEPATPAANVSPEMSTIFQPGQQVAPPTFPQPQGLQQPQSKAGVTNALMQRYRPEWWY